MQKHSASSGIQPAIDTCLPNGQTWSTNPSRQVDSNAPLQACTKPAMKTMLPADQEPLFPVNGAPRHANRQLLTPPERC